MTPLSHCTTKVRSLEKQLDKALTSSTSVDSAAATTKIRDLEAQLKSSQASVETTTDSKLEEQLAEFKAQCERQTLMLFEAELK